MSFSVEPYLRKVMPDELVQFRHTYPLIHEWVFDDPAFRRGSNPVTCGGVIPPRTIRGTRDEESRRTDEGPALCRVSWLSEASEGSLLPQFFS